MKYFLIKACILIGVIVGSYGKDTPIIGLNWIIPESWSVSKAEVGTDSVSGKIQTDKEGFSIGWEVGPGAGGVIEQRSKDGREVVTREHLKDTSGSTVGEILIVKAGAYYRAYATVSAFNFQAHCKDREQLDMFAKFIRSNFQEPKTITKENGKK